MPRPAEASEGMRSLEQVNKDQVNNPVKTALVLSVYNRFIVH